METLPLCCFAFLVLTFPVGHRIFELPKVQAFTHHRPQRGGGNDVPFQESLLKFSLGEVYLLRPQGQSLGGRKRGFLATFTSHWTGLERFISPQHPRTATRCPAPDRRGLCRRESPVADSHFGFFQPISPSESELYATSISSPPISSPGELNPQH